MIINYKSVSIFLGIILFIFIILFFVTKQSSQCNLNLLINYLFDQLEQQNIKLPDNSDCCPHCTLKEQDVLIKGFNKCKDNCSAFVISLLSGCGCGFILPNNFVAKNFDKKRCMDIFKKIRFK